MNPIRLIVYLISWCWRWYSDVKYRSQTEYVTLKKEYFR
jgi:hypothetical protein